ncbi:MAG: hypothetical protein ACK5MY_02410 [Jhaorihella sp.]
MSLLERRKIAAAHTMYNTLLGASGAEALPTVDQALGSSFATLDIVGPQVIAEQLATGRLPVEVALLYEVPILHFRAWMRKRIPDELLDEIRSAAAEALQVKAMLTLSARLANPAEASQAKALSERMARISEALAPKDWNPARVEAPQDMPSVTIVMQGMGVDTRTGPVIDGTSRSAATDRASGGGVDLQGSPPPSSEKAPLVDSSPENALAKISGGVDPWAAMRHLTRMMSEGLDG